MSQPNTSADHHNAPKGFFARLWAKLDAALAAKAKEQSSCCCNGKCESDKNAAKKDKNSCC